MAAGDPICVNGTTTYWEWAARPAGTLTADLNTLTFARIPKVNNGTLDRTLDLSKRANSDSNGKRQAGCGVVDFTIDMNIDIEETNGVPFSIDGLYCLKYVKGPGITDEYFPVKCSSTSEEIDYDDVTGYLNMDVSFEGDGDTLVA